ncbi:MAG TPA: hypothetical protein VL475_10760, partial [Planctomycetaceae bacterium]|nr:hypothetical protein [Planctomycetaceae bacterium]
MPATPHRAVSRIGLLFLAILLAIDGAAPRRLLAAEKGAATGAAKTRSKATENKSSDDPKGSRNKRIAPVEGVGTYSSKNFVVYTDLPAPEAQELLKRLETMLGLISKYWGRPLSGTIEMYVVGELRKWPAGSIPSEGLASVEAGGGLTVTHTLTQGNAFHAKSVVYATADRGTPQHEAVHAYCGQTFGRTGPVWYSEGMAEMGQYWRPDDMSVNAHDAVIRYLRSSEIKS